MESEANKMLTLGLKAGDYITIGDDVKVYVVEQKGTNIYLGIEAPKEKRILREKLHEELTGTGTLTLKNGETLGYDGRKVRVLAADGRAV